MGWGWGQFCFFEHFCFFFARSLWFFKKVRRETKKQQGSPLLGNASIVGRALDGTLRFRRWKRSRALSRCHRSLATCQAMYSEGKARSREDEMAVPPRVLSGSSFRPWGFDSSHWLFSQCFRAPSPNTAERSQSIHGHQSRKRNFGRQSSISCVWKSWDG